MSEHTLAIHTKTNALISNSLSSHFAFSKERNVFRPAPVLQRNLRAFLDYHLKADEGGTSASTTSTLPKRGVVQEPPAAGSFSRDNPTSSGDHDTARSFISLVSRDTLMVRTMDPHFEPSRRSVRHLTQKLFDEDEAELILGPVSIRKKIDFAHNRPDEDARPRKRARSDKTVQHAKCHCSLTIWDNRGDLGESSKILVEKHVSCLATWLRDERTGHIVDIEPDKPFKITAGDLKVPIKRDGEESLGVSDNYFMELQIWPIKEKFDWPPIPLLGKSDGDSNRHNRSVHSVLSGSLVAKYNNLPKGPDANTPLSIFFLDNSGQMLRTKYGLEMHGEWRASKAKINDTPGPLNNELAWAVDESSQFLGRKRPRAESSPKPLPRRHKTIKAPKRIKPPTIRYVWEADPAHAHKASEQHQTTKFKGLGCPACPLYDAQDLWELRFHFLTTHSKFNFALQEEEYDNETGDLLGAFFRVSSVQPSKKRAAEKEEFQFVAPSATLDLAAYLNGDTSWTGEDDDRPATKSRSRGAIRTDVIRTSATSKGIPGFVEDPLVALRAEHNGHLPAEHVPDFRRATRQKHKPIRLIRHTDQKVQSYDSIAHRPTDLSEEPMSETDDERNDEWYIQRHLENLAVDAEEYGRNEMKQELFRRWDKHRLEEKLDHIAFISESLIRFVRRHRRWLKNGNADLKIAFFNFTNDLLSDRLIDAQIERQVRYIIWRQEEDEDASARSSSPKSSRTKTPSRPRPISATSTPKKQSAQSSLVPEEPVSPASALAKWRAHLRLQPPNHCGVCAGALVSPSTTSVLCSARKCKTPDVRFHLDCVRAKKDAIVKSEKGKIGNKWVCMACRLEAKEAAKEGVREAATDVDMMDIDDEVETRQSRQKGKGKERAR